jgi:plasmid stabilization system protein ParE
MRITFEPGARDDLERIYAWLFDDNPQAVAATLSRIEAKLNRLANPKLAHMGRLGLVEGTRELIESPYIIVYTVHESAGEIVVVSVVHGARQRNRT